MAKTFNKRVKKEIHISADEKKKNQAIIDFTKSKFEAKTLKMGFTFKKTGSKQTWYDIARFAKKDDIKAYAQSMLDILNKTSNAWKLIAIDDLRKDDIDEAIAINDSVVDAGNN